MKTIKQAVYIILWLAISSPAAAQVPELVNDPQFRPDAKAAVDSIYNFNFDGAEKVLVSWKEEYPHHPLWTLMDGMKVWWTVLSDLENTSQDERLLNAMKKANYQAGKLLHRQSSHADGLIIQAIANGYIGRQYSNREEWISSLNYARKAMNKYEYLLDLDLDLDDLKLAQGLKMYYAAYLPEAYPVVKTVSWFLPDGDKKQGLEFIQQAAEEAIFARAEATYFLGNIHSNYEEDHATAIPYFEKLVQQYPRNNFYVRNLAKSYYQQKQYDKALRFIDESLSRWQADELPFLQVVQEALFVWKGRILERKNRTGEALKLYRQAFDIGQQLPNTRGRAFWVAAGYSVGKVLISQKGYKEAKPYLEQIGDADAGPRYRKKARDLLSYIDEQI